MKVQWYYATDIPTRVPIDPNYVQTKRATTFLPFAELDSKRIEENHKRFKGGENPQYRMVPVNEDELFDCDLEERQLVPAYWTGPSYEVRRGTWFVDGDPLPESISRQIEEAYMRVQPWLKSPLVNSARDIQNASQIASFYQPDVHIEPEVNLFEQETGKPYPFQNPSDIEKNAKDGVFTDDHTLVMVDDEISTRKLLVDALMRSRTKKIMGAFVATRGYEPTAKGLEKERQSKEAVSDSDQRRHKYTALEQTLTEEQTVQEQKVTTKSTTLEMIQNIRNTIDYEFSNERYQKDMESDFSNDPSKIENSGDRQVDHLLICVHGIGQSLSAKFTGVNFAHDCSNLRRLMKELVLKDPAKYAADNEKDPQSHRNCRVQILPIVWRYDIDFSWNHVYEDKAEDGSQRLPRLSELNIDAITPLRSLAADVVLDILLYYEPRFKSQILKTVIRSANRLYDKYLERHPDFHGKVTLCGHSLGSVIAQDIMSMQPDQVPTGAAFDADWNLKFPVENLITMGSPNGVFKLMKRQNIRPRSYDTEQSESTPLSRLDGTMTSVRCNNVYNIFYSTDIVAYRMEPMVHTAMTKYKPASIPFADENNINNRIKSWANLPTGLLDNEMVRTIAKVTGMDSQYDKAVSAARITASGPEEHELELPPMAHDMLLELNKNGRLDYALPQSYFEIDIINALGSHTQYLSDINVASFILRELWSKPDGKIRGVEIEPTGVPETT